MGTGAIAPKLPSLAPQTNSFETFFDFICDYCTARMSQFGVQTKKFSARVTRSIVFSSIFILVVLSMIAVVS